MKITRNIWRSKRHHRCGAWTFGAIIELGSRIAFVDLGDRDDEQRFNEYLADNQRWFECVADCVIIDDISKTFCIEDYDPEYYNYSFKDTVAVFQPSSANV